MPTAPKGRILIIDDEEDIRESLETLLTLEGYTVELAPLANAGLRRMEQSTYDLVLLDLMMPDKSGMEVLAEVRQRDRTTPIFLITAYGSIDVAVQALKSGANDYFSKPWDNEKLLLEIERQIAKNQLERENTELKRALKQRYSFPNIVGKSERMLKVLDLVAQVAPSRATILITGETGTGKELIAKSIHTNSTRSEQPFVAVNSGGLPPDLLESTLFGHVKGAFTGAIASHKGMFEIANRGTIFFDEIGNISLETQAKLLRVIQEREFMPLGSTEVMQVDVRLVAATNEDLKKLVEEKRFREDLYYRLNVINIPLPALRERKEDIPLLIQHFFDRFCQENGKFLNAEGKSTLRFEPDALQLLMEHNWPGNVRELENAVERAVVLANETVVPVTVLPDTLLHSGGIKIRTDDTGNVPADASLYEIVAAFERKRIIQVLETVNFSQTEAAEMLRIPLSTLNQKIKRLAIDVKKGARAAS
ncbi:MAG: sigma-54 dependent transcriptional regulator [Acidobacteria bacterium]|jgi:DNA-binding NtrC family response regulator|nr:sigma-54 dependent transcriptional regulator [Bryobacteraceae bacterium CoA2 C42]MCA2966560.1 sigma-54-dependent Fis family transcriptional regulator [Acidobacteriaceae bacterium]